MRKLAPTTVLLVVMSLLLTMISVAGPAASQEDPTGDDAAGDEAAEPSSTEDEIASAEAALATALAEDELLQREMATLGAKVRAQDLVMINNETERIAFQAEADAAREALDRPRNVRREIAKNAYVRGDPRLRAAYADLLSTTSFSESESGQVRNLLGSVDVWASGVVDETEAKLAVAEVEAQARTDRFREAETKREDLRDELATKLRARGALDSEMGELRSGLARLRIELREERAVAALAALSGEAEDPVEAKIRPALAVKIDNAPRARPQSGLKDADLVFEEIVEGRLTRFVAVFQSRDADPVGPVRSARTSDVHILGNLNNPLFANSGGNPGTLAIVNDSPLVDVGATSNGGAFRRDGSRAAPHNLYTSTAALYAADRGRGGLPPQLFSYRSPDAPLPISAEPATTLSISYGLTTATHTWDEELQGWRRATDGVAHNDASGDALAPKNVVVQFIEYGSSPADSRSPEAIMIGEGEAWILSDGHIIRGNWARPTDADVTLYTTPDGAEIPMTPGQTWVLLPKSGQASIR